jgi:integrase
MKINKYITSRLITNNEISSNCKSSKLELKANIVIEPTNDFILCQDENGNPTAIFGSNVWDFKPFATTNDKSTKLTFKIKSNLLSPGELELNLLSEIKRLLFLILYLVPKSGKYGPLSVTTLHKRYFSLMDLARYCLVISEGNSLLSNMGVQSLLSNELYLATYIKTLSEYKQSELSNLLNNIRNIKKEYLGFRVPSFKKSKSPSEQTPLIPLPIYLEAFNKLTLEVDTIWKHKDDIEAFIQEFKNSNNGSKASTLKVKKVTGNIKTLDSLLKKHNLEKFFTKSYSIKDKRNITKQISSIQLTCKHLIHLLTGMRHEEVLHMKYNCIHQEESTPRFGGPNNFVNNRMVTLISSTTKFSGYMKESHWLAPDAVIKAIEILQAITKGLAIIFNEKPELLPLFQSASRIGHIKAKAGNTTKSTDAKAYCISSLLITKKDRSLLLVSDEQRTFHEKQFKIGEPWNFTSHQYRRSLAYYGAHTGLISDATGAEQFKQITHEMQRYYRRGYSKITSLFGFYDTKEKKFSIPNDHFLYEFQTGVTLDIARQLISKIFDLSTKYFGKKGSYISRQRDGLKDNEIKILEIKKQTEKKAKEGELTYRKTLLGGCMKNGSCDQFMLGNFSTCIDCDDADIELSKVENVIHSLNEDLQHYPNDSGEYQITNSELQSLNNYRDKIVRQESFSVQ